MNVTATLLGQIITFALLVWFMRRFLWGPITNLMEQRKTRIADGLAAAEKGKHELQLAEQRSIEVIKEAKQKAGDIISHAEKRAAEIADEAKASAKAEAERILAAARNDIDQETNEAREQLRAVLSELVVQGASKILEKEIDAKAHARILDTVVKQL